jgi:starch synthase (maltosyl-transferring)
VPLITKLNKIRNANRALQRLRNLHFHHTDNEAIIAYSKRDGDNLVLVIVNLDPSNAQATVVHWNMDLLGLTGDSFVVDDQITGNSFSWNRDSFVSLDPRTDFNNVAHIAVARIS